MNNTMDDNGKRHLFALSIVDGALDDMDEERRNEIIMTITEIKESMLADIYPPKSAERKH
jgi:hypothetical protein